MAAALLLTGGLGAAAAAPADAATCTTVRSAFIDDGSAWMTAFVYLGCSDGYAQVYGTVADSRCDARAAYGTVWYYNGGNQFWYRRDLPEATRGCGTSATYSYRTSNNWPHVQIAVHAGNRGPTQSRGASAWVS
jgi:hypothetical protein